MLANKGPLTGPAALKGAHFIRLCTLRGVPLVFLQNTPSDREFLSPSGNDGETVKARARMMATLACSHVPKITVAMGNSYGPSSYAMVSSIICVSVYVLCKCGYQWLVPPLLVLHLQCGRSMQPNFLFSWPHSRMAVADPHHIMEALGQQVDRHNFSPMELVIL